jgi:hypothetical protein
VHPSFVVATDLKDILFDGEPWEADEQEEEQQEELPAAEAAKSKGRLKAAKKPVEKSGKKLLKAGKRPIRETAAFCKRNTIEEEEEEEEEE